MKSLTIILLIIPLVCFSQDELEELNNLKNRLDTQLIDLKERVRIIEDSIIKIDEKIFSIKMTEDLKIDTSKFYALTSGNSKFFDIDYNFSVLDVGSLVEIIDYDYNRGFKFKVPGTDKFYYGKDDKLIPVEGMKDFTKVKEIADQIKDEEKIERLKVQGNRNLAKQRLRMGDRAFQISELNISNINSAGGVSFKVSVDYANSKKIIKYIYININPYNAVGDIVQDRISRSSLFKGSITGPIEASTEMKSYTFENAWYDHTIRCLKIERIEIIYMDGSNEIYIKDLPQILSNELINTKC